MPTITSIGNKLAAILTIVGIIGAVGFICYQLLSKAWFWIPLVMLASPLLLLSYILHKHTTLKVPVNLFADRIFLGFYNFFIYRRLYIWDFIYDMLCWLLPSSEWKHMNWGYAALNEDGHSIELKPEDENERFSIQYSHFVATAMGEFQTLEGKTIVEVSSGRGGGLDYLSRYLNPKKCIGIDLSDAQVKFCNKNYSHNNKLVFYQADAQALASVNSLKDETIDIVINIDSGHCYSNFRKFVQEVEKILAPGGVFIYTDFRPVHDWEKIEKDMENSFIIKKKANITQNAIHSLKLDEERKIKLMKGTLGPVMRFYFSKIGGVKGSLGWEGLNSGSHCSMTYVLQKA